jgi:hypothetical protein
MKYYFVPKSTWISRHFKMASWARFCNHFLPPKTYTFLFFFHSTGHLGDCSINGWILWKIRQLFRHIYRHRLRGVERPSPKRELAHGCWQATHTSDAAKKRAIQRNGDRGRSVPGTKPTCEAPNFCPWCQFTRTQSQFGKYRMQTDC